MSKQTNPFGRLISPQLIDDYYVLLYGELG